MRVAVLGAGAIGGVVGGLLARRGADVTLIGRGEHVRRIQEEGLRLEYAGREECIPVAASDALTFAPDITLVTVKTQDLAAALQGAADYLRGTMLVTLMNGLQADRIAARILPGTTIVGGVVSTVATYLEPGRVSCQAPGHVVLGAPPGTPKTKVQAVASLLRQAIPTRVTNDLTGARWLHQLLCSTCAIPAATGLTFQQLISEDSGARLLASSLRESYRLVRQSGQPLASLSGLPKVGFRLLAVLPLGTAVALYRRRMRRVWRQGKGLGCMLQSILRGRKTEVDYLNGEIVRLAQELGEEAPVNAALVEAVHRVEATGRFVPLPDLVSQVGPLSQGSSEGKMSRIRAALTEERGETFWTLNAPSIPEFPSLAEDIAVDVAIIGGGFTGLACAVYLKRFSPNTTVAVLESHRLGSGASSRNAGAFAVECPGWWRIRGWERARACNEMAQRAFERLSSFIAEERIDCGLTAKRALLLATKRNRQGL